MRTIADFIFDLAQNSINARAKSIDIYIEENDREDLLKIVIKDDGKGIRSENLPRVKDTFFTTREESKRKVGLGLSLLDAACSRAGPPASSPPKQARASRWACGWTGVSRTTSGQSSSE